MIPAPRIVLNEEVCKRNIERMATKVASAGASFRPHFKTHQSVEIGEWFRPHNVSKIAVSSFAMASYFADHWDDILVAVPVNPGAIDVINDLATRTELGLLFESVEAVQLVSQGLQHHVNGFIKIDTGYHRVGIAADQIEEVEKVINAMEGTKIKHEGFVAHAGHSYDCRGEEEVLKVHEASIIEYQKVISHFGPGYIYSYGDTPSCSIAETFEGINELRPGNFVFYDLSQAEIGSCQQKDIAVYAECPLIGLYPSRNEVVMHGGSVDLSKDVMKVNGMKSYGLVTHLNNTELSNPLNVNSLSQEHGKIEGNAEFFSQAKIGDVLRVLPVHSCLLVDKHSSYHGVVNNVIYSKM